MKIYQFIITSIILIGLFSTGVMAATSFCNRIEAGSSVDAGGVNLRTSASDLFVLSAGHSPVEMDYQILVSELQPGTPSRGTVSSFMNALIQEGGDDTPTLREMIRYREYSSVTGQINVFEKLMHYQSGFSF